MYRKGEDQIPIEAFDFSGAGSLNPKNRWVVLSHLIPWEEVEAEYRQNFSSEGLGAPSKPARMALGSLLIKERLGCSDEEAVEQICENPYLQYFIGLSRYQRDAPFDSSMLVHFRKRFSLEMLARINERTVEKMRELGRGKDDEPPRSRRFKRESSEVSGAVEPAAPKQNAGKQVMDATCVPADITYPTDLKLLNTARRKTEEMIDRLYEVSGQIRKPRTYRMKAHRLWLELAKSKKVSSPQLRKAIGQQLRFLKRNLKPIEHLSERVSLKVLKRVQYRELLVIHEVYRQQGWMYQNRACRIEGRIVSIFQPHVRPIVRGKVSAPTEFGAKLSASLCGGFVFLDHLNWNAFNESSHLIQQVEAFKRRFGCYPESVHVDKIYRTQENRAFCKSKGIRLSGPPLGRPVQQTKQNQVELKQQKKIARQDELERIPIEGKFGQAKRRFSLNRVMTKRANTSECAIAIVFLLINLEKGLALFFVCLAFLTQCLRMKVKFGENSSEDRQKRFPIQLARWRKHHGLITIAA